MLTSHPTGGAWVGSVRTLADYILQPYYYTKSDVCESPLIWLIFSRNTTLGPPAEGFRNLHYLLYHISRVKDPFGFRVRASGTLFPPPCATFHHIAHLRGRCGNISSIGTPSPLKTSSRYWPLASLGESGEIWLLVNVERNNVQWLWYCIVFKKEDWYLFYFIYFTL